MRNYRSAHTLQNRNLLPNIFRWASSLIFLLSTFSATYGQGVGVNEDGTDPDPSAILDVKSNSRGMLVPRLTKAVKLGIPGPANGLLVYQTDDTIGFWYYDINRWKPVFQNITAGNGLTGNKIEGYGTINLEPTGITTGQYGNADSIPQFTVNAFGQLVFARNVALREQDGIIGNEITDTANSLGLLNRAGSGTSADPYTVGVNSGSSQNDIWMWDGNNWVLTQFPFEQDSIIGNEISDTAQSRGILIRNGRGNSANPYTLGVTAGSAIGDVFMWDGNKWVSNPIVFPTEQDGIIGNELTDTTNARGVINRQGSGTTANPYKISVNAGNNVGDVWMWDGNKWTSSSVTIPSEQDSVIGNEVTDTINARGVLNLYGSGTQANPLKMGIEPGNSTGDVWMWNGSSWVPSQITHPPVIIPKEKDSVIGNEIADTFNTYGLIVRQGSGTDVDPYTIGAKPGTSAGQSLVWDGTKWVLTTIVIPLEKDSVIGNEIADTLGSNGILTRGGTGVDADPFTVGINSGSASGDVWMWNGTSWVPTQITHPNEVDGIIGNELTDTINARGVLQRSGSGTVANPYKIGVTTGKSNGDVWMWNGSNWVPSQIVHPNEVDGIVGNEVTDTIANGFLNLTGAGTAASPKKVGLKSGNTVGDVIVWDGTTWVPGYLDRNTLDMAYDEGGAGNGRTITADNGAVEIKGADGFLVDGKVGTGATAGSIGASTRLHFNPRTSAFRAGTAVATEWDAANLGLYSTAFGYGSLASDDYTFAAGKGASAVGDHSIAIGDSTVTLLEYSIAMGNRSVTGGKNTMAIGTGNTAYGQYSFITGINSRSLGTNSGIFGEECFVLSGYKHGYAFGHRDTVKGDYAVAIGHNAYSEGTGAVAIGFNVRTNNPYSVAIGNNADAIADRSVAIGSFVSTNLKNGSFIFGDGSTTTTMFSPAQHTMTMRFNNGYRLYSKSDLTTGVYMLNGGTSWTSVSDRNMKENFEDINGEDLLDKIEDLPITKWNYKGNPDSVKFIGPMAQDFHKSFGLGGSDSLGISTLAFDGVNIAAVQALIVRTNKIENLESTISKQGAEIKALKEEIVAIKNLLKK
ncbi:MAG: tail fiber domain-containing protein [Bacteroidetes bacterium]|nr:tail fiber domain-containing protein [Bacteroidota bacterium]